MNETARQNVIISLCELSSADEQRRLWLSTGVGNSDVSSFTEVIEQLFTDTGLSDDLIHGPTGFSSEVNERLCRLDTILKSIDSQREPLAIIEDPAMNAVRSIAKDVLKMLGFVREG